MDYFGAFVDRLYPIRFEVKDTTFTARFVSYNDLQLEFDSKGRLRTERNYFNFPIANSTCSNILAAPTYGVYIPQLTRYSRACDS